MWAFIVQHGLSVLGLWITISVLCLLIRAWLLKRGEAPASLPMQSRILVESSAVAIVADSWLFAILFEVLLAAFGETTFGFVLALLVALAASPLQLKFALRKFRQPNSGGN